MMEGWRGAAVFGPALQRMNPLDQTDSLEAGVTSQDVVPRLFDHHPVHRQNMKSDLNQNVLERRKQSVN